MQTSTATRPHNKKAVSQSSSSISVRSFLSASGMEAAACLDKEKSLAAIEVMFEDAFLYGYKADQKAGYSEKDRAAIWHIYNGFKAIIPMLSNYHWLSAGNELISEVDYKELYDFMEDAIDMQAEGLPLLEAMMITSILYKYAHAGDSPADWNRPEQIYSTYTRLRSLITGYIPKQQHPRSE